MERITDGLYRLRLPLPGPLGHVNCYVVDAGGKVVLVDPGPDLPQFRRSLLEELDAVEQDVGRLSCVVATHGHPDHCGLAPWLQATRGVPVAIHPRDAEYFRAWQRGDLAQRIQDWVQREFPPVQVPGVEAAVRHIMAMGQTLAPMGQAARLVNGGGWEFIHTPGHSPGHVCLYDRERQILLTGDHVLPDETPNVGMAGLAPETDPLGDYLQSLATVAQLPVRLALPGHGDPFEDLPGRVQALIRHHEERLADILQAVKAGARSPYDVARSIRWTRARVSFDELGPLDRLLAFQEAAAHLRHLSTTGRLREIDDHGRLLYSPIA